MTLEKLLISLSLFFPISEVQLLVLIIFKHFFNLEAFYLFLVEV